MSKECAISEDGQHVLPCDALQKITEFGNPTGRKKGVFAWRLHAWDAESDSFKPSRTIYGAKSGDHVGDGCLFNFCPFCGERIYAPLIQQRGDDPKGSPEQ